MRRAAKRISIGALVALATLAAFGAWLVGTESGLHTAWRIGSSLVPDDVQIRAVRGRLVGPLVLDGVTFENADLRVRVERIELEWKPTALLRRTFHVDRLHASGIDAVRLPRGPAPADDAPFRLPEELSTPIAVDVALASPPERDAPAMTTAAIGARR